MSALALPADARRPSPPAATAPATRTVTPRAENPLLPPQFSTEGLFPELSVNPKVSTADPTIYTPQDFQIYRETFGPELDKLTSQRGSSQIAFAQKLLAAISPSATTTSAPATIPSTPRPLDPSTPSYARLLSLRAMAIAYRLHEGTPVAAQAIAMYQQNMDLRSIPQVAGLWAMADAMTKYATTPKPDRQKFSNLAAKANIQLAMLMLEASQVQAAQSVIAMLKRHDAAIHADPILRGQAAQARAAVGQSVEMLTDLGHQYAALEAGEVSAAMPLYIYARYVKPSGALTSEILARGQTSPVTHLHTVLQQAQSDPMVAFAAGEALKAAAGNLPEGILRSRALYGAYQMYHLFLTSAVTEDKRVERTLATMAKQAVLSDGARPNPVILPFAPPPPTATAPATTRPGATSQLR